MGMDIPQKWWELFKSPPLNALIEKSLKANPTIDAAKAALRQARENVLAQVGYYYPTVQAGALVTHARDSGTISPMLNSGAEPYTLHTAQVSVGYTPDLFGANRRQVESLQAQEDFQRFQLEATYLTLTSNVAAAAIQEASLRSQISATLSIIKIETEMLDQLRTAVRAWLCCRDWTWQRRKRPLPRRSKPCRRWRTNWRKHATCLRPLPDASQTTNWRRSSSLAALKPPAGTAGQPPFEAGGAAPGRARRRGATALRQCPGRCSGRRTCCRT